jgi:type I restriction enzyme M protein
VFSPYTSIPTNLLFFDRTGPTKDIWYFELPLPEGRKQYTKTMPLQFEEFAPCLKWWPKRKANGQAWRVAAKDVLKKARDGSVTVNLDIKNPSAKQDLEHLPPGQLVESIIEKEKRILALMAEIRVDLEKKP